MRPAPRPTPLKLLPAKSRIVSQPLGQALIVAPWNYPVQLLLNPLVGAISAGCTALLKPSPYTPNVAEALEGMIAEDLRRGVRRRRAGRPRGQHPAVRHALGRDLLHGKPRAGTDRDDRRGPQPHARRAGTGRQKPLDRGPRRRHRGRGAPHRLGQDPQRRADLHRTRLPADPPIAARRVLPSLRPLPCIGFTATTRSKAPTTVGWSTTGLSGA